MSIHWMNRVWDLSQHKGSYLLAMLAISDNANDYGVAWPGYPLIARKTRLSTRTIPRLVEHLVESSELAVHSGGGGRRDTNLYVLLLGREADEVAKIIEMLKQKHVNLSSLKAGQFVMLDKLSWKKPANKHDTAVSSDPSRTNGKNLDGWMETDPICCFLKELPGYNAAGLKTDRAAIAPHAQAYDLEALQYLWSDCEADAQDNPIGLFLYRAQRGLQSPRFVELCARRRAETDRINTPRATLADVKAAPPPSIPVEDASAARLWFVVRQELSTQISAALLASRFKPLVPVRLNGSLTLAVPTDHDLEYLRNNSVGSLERILKGVSGRPIPIELVTYAQAITEQGAA